MENKKTTLKDLRNSQKKVHQQEIDEIISQTYESKDYAKTLQWYKQKKKMKWWSYLISFSIIGFSIGVSYLIGYLLINWSKAPNWQATAWVATTITSLLFLTWMIMNWVRNKQATKYYNDRKRRYQKTLTDWEATIQLVKKIIFLAFLGMLIFTIVANVVYQ